MKKWKLPVTWEVCGELEVEAETLEDAVDMFYKDPDWFALPDYNEYVDGSFDLSCCEIEYIRCFNKEVM